MVKNLPAKAGDRFDHWSRTTPHAKEHLKPYATTVEPVLWSPRAIATEPTCGNCWSLRAYNLSPATREATTMRRLRTATREKPAKQRRKPSTADKQARSFFKKPVLPRKQDHRCHPKQLRIQILRPRLRPPESNLLFHTIPMWKCKSEKLWFKPSHHIKVTN